MIVKRENGKTLALIPCFNEEVSIGSIVLKTRPFVDEVVVVDDGSSDQTAQIAKQAGAIVLIHHRNQGKAQAIKTGFRYALKHGYSFIVTLDGDGQHNPSEIPILLSRLQEGNHDIIIGTRFGKSTEMPLWRKVGKRVLDYTTSFGSGGQLTDSQSGFRVFTMDALKKITPRLNGGQFSTESEQLIRAHDFHLSVGQARISCKYQDLDTSTKDPTSHGFSVLGYAIWLVAEKRPLLFIGVPGFISVIIGLVFGIFTLQYYNATHVFPIHYAILVSIFIIVGVIAMFMGLVLNVLPNMFKRFQGEIEEPVELK
jgi:glycosyltransferase involved in cell wall biosynthesis